MKNLFYCLNCDIEFQTPKWNGSMVVCPNCESLRWYDIEEEKEEHVMKKNLLFRMNIIKGGRNEKSYFR